MSRFARLAVATMAATMVLIALGGVVRAMEAGLGCPDWPTCYGAANPPSELAAGPLKLAWIEHSHRLWASVVMVLIVVLAVAARRTAQPPAVRRATALLVPAVLSQALLGALVVWARLDAETVTLHLGGALTILALSAYVVLHSLGLGPTPGARLVSGGGRALSVVAIVTTAASFGQMLLGSTVTGYDAGLAFTTFPSFSGRFLPPLVAEPAPWLHVAHRALAYTLVVLFAVLAVRVRRTPGVEPLVVRLSEVAAVLVLVQVGLGAANIWWRLSAWTVVPHLVVGSWIWLVAVVITLRVRWQHAPADVDVPRSSRAEQLVSR
ncbi:MAG TPA: COX15/CtaA family protein [Mycobacteriales bacterium]|nr:COX15/CtaA family protein [Mycobacteriales bacterium]